MPQKVDPNCNRPGSGAAVKEVSPTEAPQPETQPMEEETMIQVGKKAPDFTASAYVDGDFASVQLSEYLGQWVVLCFYPGDFTFV